MDHDTNQDVIPGNGVNYCSSLIDHDLNGFGIAAIIVCFCGLFLTSLCNTLNLLILPRMANKFGENARLCLLCLAVIDFMGGLMCYGSRIIFQFDQSLLLTDRTVCAIVSAACTTFVSQSNLLLLVVSIDRFVAITKPMRYPILLSKTRIKVFIAVAIVCGTVVSVLRAVHAIYTNTCDFDPGASMYITHPSMFIYTVLVFILGLVTAYLNMRLLVIARNHHRRLLQIPMKELDNQQPQRPKLKVPHPAGKLKATVTVSVIVGTYYLVWTPYTVGSLTALCTMSCVPNEAYVCMIAIAFSNHFLNALIYYSSHKNYRSNVNNIMKGEQIRPTRTNFGSNMSNTHF